MDRDGRFGAPADRLGAAADHSRFGGFCDDQPRTGLTPIHEPGSVETTRKCMVAAWLGGLLHSPQAGPRMGAGQLVFGPEVGILSCLCACVAVEFAPPRHPPGPLAAGNWQSRQRRRLPRAAGCSKSTPTRGGYRAELGEGLRRAGGVPGNPTGRQLQQAALLRGSPTWITHPPPYHKVYGLWPAAGSGHL